MSLFEGLVNDAPAQQQQATKDGPQAPGLADQWKDWVHRPENDAALLQFGTTLLQPLALGQNTLGQIGSAVGEGMEARDRNIQGQRDTAAAQAAASKTAAETGRLQQQTETDKVYKNRMSLAALLRAKNGPASARSRNLSWPEYAQKMRGAEAQNGFSTPMTDAELYKQWQATQVVPSASGTGGGAPAPVLPPGDNAPVAGTGGGNYEEPQTQQDYDAIPSGAPYLDPTDGQVYLKG